MSTFTNDEIRRIVYEIRTSNINRKADYFSAKYADFNKAFPLLFDAALNDTFPLKFLELMLNQRAQLANTEPTKENIEEVNKVVYTALRETYIDPLVATLPTPLPKQENAKALEANDDYEIISKDAAKLA